MELKIVEPNASPVSEVRRAYDRLREAARQDPLPSAADRQDRLDRLARLLRRNRDDIAQAISEDFGGRSRHETMLADILPTLETVTHARRHVAAWMRPRAVSPGWMFRPARAHVQPQPLGVVGIIAPWNYPVNLVFAPLAGALAAGNRALVKPSELTPRTQDLVARLVRETFTPDEVQAVQGGPAVARELTELPLDHLFFTGSTRVGREVAQAAAKNLTPVTLELGGKSPALIHPDYPLSRAADHIVAGKLFNAGQTCVAPDYVLVESGKEEPLLAELRRAIQERYPNLATNPDYSSIATRAGFERLRAVLADAVDRGARAVTIVPGADIDPSSRRFPPTVILGATAGMRVMEEEIFGPLLPLVGYRTLSDAIASINAREKPLAFYYFDTDEKRARDVLDRTSSGGACVNDTLLHFAQENLPFGGVGESGQGAYHGQAGFDTFSHLRGVFFPSGLSPVAKLVAPPFGRLLDRALDTFIGGHKRKPGE